MEGLLFIDKSRNPPNEFSILTLQDPTGANTKLVEVISCGIKD
jgi:hypothetical protein